MSRKLMPQGLCFSHWGGGRHVREAVGLENDALGNK